MLNYTMHLLILAYSVGCVYISAFVSLFCFPVNIASSTTTIKITAVIAVGLKKYISIIRKKKKKHDKIVLLAKTKLNTTEPLISKALIDSNISHD